MALATTVRIQTALVAVTIVGTFTRGLGDAFADTSSSCSSAEAIVSNVTVTDAHRRQYQEDGYVVFDNFLDANQLQVWRRTIDGAVTARGDAKFAPGTDMEDGTNEDLAYFDKVFTQRINLHMDSDDLQTFLIIDAGHEIGRIARELTGHAPGFRLWHNQALYKEPYANPTSWHVDVPYWSFNSAKAISAWIALDDADVLNGCLHFLPGSHRVLMDLPDPYREVKIGKNIGSLFHQISSPLTELDPVPVPMRAGSISFHNGLTAHAAGPNMTPRRRRAMTYQLMPVGDNRFNGKRNVLGRAYYESLRVGDTLDNDAVNPLL